MSAGIGRCARISTRRVRTRSVRLEAWLPARQTEFELSRIEERMEPDRADRNY
jgi:hypothetical protein